MTTIKIYNTTMNFGLFDHFTYLVWVAKKEDKYVGMHDVGPCKDWLHEAISDYIHDTRSGGKVLLNSKKDVSIDFDNDPLQIGMIVKPGSYKKLKGFIKYLNYYERKANLTPTKMEHCKIERLFINPKTKEHELKEKDIKDGVLFHFDPKYYKAFPLIHLIILIIRNSSKFVNGTNITELKTYKKLNLPDELDHIDINATLIKESYIDIILSNFDKIYEDISIGQVHPIYPNHNDFGIRALNSGRYHNKTILDRVNSLRYQKIYVSKFERLRKMAKKLKEIND